MEVKDALQQYLELREQENLIKKRKSEMGKFLKDYATQHGDKDQKGSSYLMYDNYSIGSVKTTKVTFNQERALDFFTNQRSDLLEEVSKEIVFISEDKVTELVQEGKLSMEEVNSLCDFSTSFKVDIRAIQKEEENEKPKVKCKPRVKKLIRK